MNNYERKRGDTTCLGQEQRRGLIEAILEHLERNGPLADVDLQPGNAVSETNNVASDLDDRAQSALPRSTESTMMNMFERMMAQIAEQQQ